MRNEVPCLNCKDRYLGCHDRCDRYKVYKEENKRVKEMRNRYYQEHGVPTFSYQYGKNQ